MISDKKNRGIIVFLLITIMVIGLLAFQNYKDYSNLKTAFQGEKKELELELDKIITDYDKAITDKIGISKKLRKERLKVLQFKDTIKNLQEKNYYLIRVYRKRITKLENQNKLLFAKVDSLNEANTYLQVENIAVKEELNEKKQLAHKLFQKNSNLKKDQKNLIKTVKKAQLLEAKNIVVIPMKKKRSGRYTSTSRSKKTEAFKITLDVLKNDVAPQGERKLYVQVLDENKKTISPDGVIALENGTTINYSDSFTLDYKNKATSLVSLVKMAKGSLKKGKYTVSIFLENKMIGDRIVELK